MMYDASLSDNAVHYHTVQTRHNNFKFRRMNAWVYTYKSRGRWAIHSISNSEALWVFEEQADAVLFALLWK
jgi:hypothetical protein